MTLFALFPSGASAAWKTSIVDGKSFGNFYPKALALEKGTNLPHIAYGGSHLFHAFFDGSSWKKEVVDSAPSVGSYASIALDSNNKIHISYYDAANHTLKYATNKYGIWSTAAIDTTLYFSPESSASIGVSYVGGDTSIAIDSRDRVHISYRAGYNGHSSLNYATNSSGVWSASIIDNSGDVGAFSSIGIDSAAGVHISYFDSGCLKYITDAD